MSREIEFAITTIPGLEDVAAQECGGLGITIEATSSGFIRCRGKKEDFTRLLLFTRTVLRVLDPIFQGNFQSQGDLEKHLFRFSWERFLRPWQTFKILTIGRSSLASDRFLTLRIKDSIVDRLSLKQGKRPSVDTKNPDVTLTLFLGDSNVTVYRDAAGKPLSFRGYRSQAGEAPLNEVIAAGLCNILGWQGRGVFIDPMCGSGTIAIEAALISKGLYPQRSRPQGFAISHWPDKKAFGWQDSAEFSPEPLHGEFCIIAADRDPKMIKYARQNARRAGVEMDIHFVHSPFNQLHERTAGIRSGLSSSGENHQEFILMNPPYDKRLNLQDDPGLYTDIGDTLKQQWSGAVAGVFTANGNQAKHIGLRTDRKITIKNGPLDGRFLIYTLY